MPLPKTISDAERTKKISSFLRDSFNDYIAARVLFRDQLPQQASILSSTAIEKCVKAMLAVQGNESHGHLQTAHRNFLRNFNPKLHSKLNNDFLVLNQKVYALRYSDDLPAGYNLVIASREFLAEMDFTIAAMFSCFSLNQGNRRMETPYEVAVAGADHRLWVDNHVLHKIPNALFTYAEPQFVYEVRNDPRRGLMEVTYIANGPSKQNGFLRSGWTPRDDIGVKYDLAFGAPTAQTPDDAQSLGD
ncbi:MAG: HEPN domain-containing protein [Chthoniobacterales bacterium]|nr:HEPN domain-containing protein [Chthoniobacterales bacterium]